MSLYMPHPIRAKAEAPPTKFTWKSSCHALCKDSNKIILHKVDRLIEEISILFNYLSISFLSPDLRLCGGARTLNAQRPKEQKEKWTRGLLEGTQTAG